MRRERTFHKLEQIMEPTLSPEGMGELKFSHLACELNDFGSLQPWLMPPDVDLNKASWKEENRDLIEEY